MDAGGEQVAAKIHSTGYRADVEGDADGVGVVLE